MKGFLVHRIGLRHTARPQLGLIAPCWAGCSYSYRRQRLHGYENVLKRG